MFYAHVAGGTHAPGSGGSREPPLGWTPPRVLAVLGVLSDRVWKLHEGQLETRRVLQEELLETRKMLQKHFGVKEARALDLVNDRTPREDESAAEEYMSSAGEEKETP